MNGEELIVYALLQVFKTSFLKELGLYILLETSHGVSNNK